jgi:hypothetical protein
VALVANAMLALLAFRFWLAKGLLRRKAMSVASKETAVRGAGVHLLMIGKSGQ